MRAQQSKNLAQVSLNPRMRRANNTDLMPDKQPPATNSNAANQDESALGLSDEEQ